MQSDKILNNCLVRFELKQYFYTPAQEKETFDSMTQGTASFLQDTKQLFYDCFRLMVLHGYLYRISLYNLLN
jgi:hypothetical protein